MKFDPTLAQRAADFHDRDLRPFLIAEAGDESPIAVALALLYELTSVVATMSDTDDQAKAVLHTFLHAAEYQIDEFGTGEPHP